MKFSIDIKKGDIRCVFIFGRIFLPFFKCYFGRELRKVAIVRDGDSVIRFKLFFFGRSERLVNADRTVVLYIPLIKIFRAFVRSLYQTLSPGSSSVGLFEYFVQLIRLSFLEPLECRLAQDGFFLVHGAVLKRGDESVLLILAESKGGKSTVSKIYESYGYQVLSDNYAFFDGLSVLTVPECRRYGVASRFSFSFYGKGVYGVPDQAWIKITKLIKLSFAVSFGFELLSSDGLADFLTKTYLIENEGCYVLQPDTVIKNFLEVASMAPPIPYCRLDMVRDIDRTKRYIGELIGD